MSVEQYGMSRRTSLPYDEAVTKVRELLKDQGFGVLTEIDVRQAMRQKLDVDFRKYVILGACNPQLAHRALQRETDVGLLLPCNVIVYEQDGGSTVGIQDPDKLMSIAGEHLHDVAEDARRRLSSVLEGLP